MATLFPVLDGSAPVYVDRGPALNRGIDMLLQGTKDAAAYYKDEQDKRETNAALQSPLIQQMIRNSLTGDVAGGARALIPSVEGQAMGANLGATTMGPTLGYRLQPPRGLVPADGSSPPQTGSEAQPYYIDEHLADLQAGSKPGGGFDAVVTADPNHLYTPGAGDGIHMIGNGQPGSTQFMENMTVTPRQLNSGGGVADLHGAITQSPLTWKQYALFQQMLPYYTQANVARMQASSAERRSADKTTAGAVANQGKMAIELLKIDENRLKREQQRELFLKKLKAGGNKTGNKYVEELRKAWQISVNGKQSSEGIVSQMIASGADASENGSEARTAYDGMRSKVKEWTDLENNRRQQYQEALRLYGMSNPGGQSVNQPAAPGNQAPAPKGKPKGLGRPIKTPADVANASDEELMQYWRETQK
jgi:hypothetical protein